MFKFLKPSRPVDATDSRMGPQSLPSQLQESRSAVTSHSDLQRELIRVVLKDTLRRNGIPLDWLACEVITIVQSGNSKDQLHIQLMLMKWHELFLRYAPALEHQLLRGLDRFDPSVDHSHYIISWRFSPDCGCPFSTLPSPVVWLHSEKPKPVVQEPASVLDRRKKPRPPKGTAKRAAPTRGNSDDDRTELAPLR